MRTGNIADLISAARREQNEEWNEPDEAQHIILFAMAMREADVRLAGSERDLL